MQITSIDIAEPDAGLEPISLNRFSKIVMLAGKNGSGKTRILEQIKNKLANKPSAVRAASLERAIPQNISEIKRASDELEKYIKRREMGENVSATPLSYGDEKSHKVQIERFKSELDSFQAEMACDVETNPYYSESYNVIDLVPKGLNLKNHKQLTGDQTKTHFSRVTKLGAASLEQGTLAYIFETHSRYKDATHPEIEASAEEQAEAIKSYNDLNALIMDFLGETLTFDIGTLKIFDLPIEQAKLSNGQKILLQLCVEIHAQKASLKNIIIFLDEPENHLHPAACIDFISIIKKTAPECQMWIATHSIALLSYFNEATLLFVEDGKVSYKGSEPETVFASLIGDEERVGKLQDFISLPSVYAMNKYAAECLIPPEAVAAKDHDDQIEQIRTHLQELIEEGQTRPLRVLDFGSGKGRLLESLVSLWPEAKDNIQFIAYDKFSEDAERCKQVIESYYGTSENLYFNKESEISTHYGDDYFDVVIMCNVLHEIEPKEWLSLFRDKGAIPSLLNENGVALIVEDEIIPVGEKAHVKGFIVFDTPELRKMFKIKTEEEFLFSDQRQNGRLKAHLLPKKYLVRIDAASRLDALERKKVQAEREILAIRQSEDTSYRSGRKHSFWIQQLANTQLAINELK